MRICADGSGSNSRSDLHFFYAARLTGQEFHVIFGYGKMLGKESQKFRIGFALIGRRSKIDFDAPIAHCFLDDSAFGVGADANCDDFTVVHNHDNCFLRHSSIFL